MQIYENETYFPLQFIDLKIIWLAQRYTIISSIRWVLGITCTKPLKAWVYTNKIEKLRLLLELTLLEICAQNQGNSVSGDLKCKNFLGGHALQCSIITIQLLRNFCQLLEKLWTTLYREHRAWYPNEIKPLSSMMKFVYSVILLLLCPVSLTHRNPKRCKIIFGMHANAQTQTCHNLSNVPICVI